MKKKLHVLQSFTTIKKGEKKMYKEIRNVRPNKSTVEPYVPKTLSDCYGNDKKSIVNEGDAYVPLTLADVIPKRQDKAILNKEKSPSNNTDVEEAYVPPRLFAGGGN